MFSATNPQRNRAIHIENESISWHKNLTDFPGVKNDWITEYMKQSNVINIGKSVKYATEGFVSHIFVGKRPPEMTHVARAKVAPSQKRGHYNVFAEMTQAKVIYGYCTCPAGLV